MAEATDGTISDEAVVLRVVHRADIDLERARAAFADPGWLGQASSDEPVDGWRRIATDLELPIRDGSGPAVRKTAVVDVGVPRETNGGVVVPLAWRSASFAPLFPVFAGQVEIRRSSVTLAGRYAPPFGRMGMLIDQTLLHFVATRSATALLATVAGRCQKGPAGLDDR